MSPSAPHHTLNEIYAEWNNSIQCQVLCSFLERVLLEDSVVIDSAICLGLGNLRISNRSAPKAPYDIGPFDFVPEEDDYLSDWTCEQVVTVEAQLLFHGKNISRALYQLLIFETAISCLRQKFHLSDVRFQDPQFNTEDVAFLEKRGYTVVPWPEHIKPGYFGVMRCDPTVLSTITESTFVFAPYLDLPPEIEVICAARPLLFLGPYLFPLVSSVWMKQELVEPFKEFLRSRDHRSMRALGTDFWFSFSVDLFDDKSQRRLQKEWDGCKRSRVRDWNGPGAPERKRTQKQLRDYHS